MALLSKTLKNKPVHEVFVSLSLVQQTIFSTVHANWLVMVSECLLLDY
jgi:hypothetical protein